LPTYGKRGGKLPTSLGCTHPGYKKGGGPYKRALSLLRVERIGGSYMFVTVWGKEMRLLEEEFCSSEEGIVGVSDGRETTIGGRKSSRQEYNMEKKGCQKGHWGGGGIAARYRSCGSNI